MFKTLKLLFLSLFLAINAYSVDVVSNKEKLFLKTPDGVITADELRGKFTFMWFFDTRCPYCIKSVPDLKTVLSHIENNYEEDMNVIFVEAVPKSYSEIEKFMEHFGFSDYTYAMVPDMDMNNYMNVTSTPTLIILDPYLNIVDKIEGVVIAPIYIRHLDIIMQRYYDAVNNSDYEE